MKYRKVLVSEINKPELAYDDFTEKIENPDEVIVRNKYSIISAGSELACLEGTESWFSIPGVPGYAAVGEVLEKGSAVEGVETGDLVYTYGPHAELFKITAGERWHGMCIKVPDGLEPSFAPFTKMATIAITAIRVSNIELGDYVAVTGLGPIGNFAAQLAQLQGGKVLGIDISDKRLKLANDCGIENTINSNDPDYAEKLKAFTRGKGFSTYIDASGLSPVIEDFLQHISIYGEAVLLGSPRKPYQTDLTETLNRIHLFTHGSITMKGAIEFRYPTHETEFVKHSAERNARIIMDLMNEDKLKLKPFFTHLANPADARKMYDGLREKKDEYIGVVFDWTK